jgi:hypothetical protein
MEAQAVIMLSWVLPPVKELVFLLSFSPDRAKRLRASALILLQKAWRLSFFSINGSGEVSAFVDQNLSIFDVWYRPKGPRP